MAFIIKNRSDVQKLLRKNQFSELLQLANELDGEYGKVTATLLMKDLMEHQAGKLFVTLYKKGAILPMRGKPGPKVGAKRKSSPSPKQGEPVEERELEPEEPEQEQEPEHEPVDENEFEAEEERAFDTPSKRSKSRK